MLDTPSSSEIHIRAATPGEADALSALAFRSKAHWGYEPAFLEACRPELTITADQIARAEVYVLEAEGQVIGFYSLSPRVDGEIELSHLFVDPSHVSRGFGKALGQHAVETARALGHRELIIQGDPHARAFYRAMGARQVGEIPSTAWPARMLPLFRVALV